MECKFEKMGKTLVSGVFGELDHHNAASLREEMDTNFISSGAKNMVIDLSGLELMDSSGIGVIMGRYRLVNSRGGKLFVSGAKPSIKKIIELSGLGKLVSLCDTAEQALKGGMKNEG